MVWIALLNLNHSPIIAQLRWWSFGYLVRTHTHTRMINGTTKKRAQIKRVYTKTNFVNKDPSMTCFVCSPSLAKPRFFEMWTLGVDAHTSRIYIFATRRVLSISFKYDITTHVYHAIFYGDFMGRAKVSDDHVATPKTIYEDFHHQSQTTKIVVIHAKL